jgi:hypothetical protein
MRPHITSPDLAALRRLWRRWTALVALQARRGRGAQVVDPQEYQTLHRELVAACFAAGAAAEGTQREFYQRLEDLARPWLTARVLQQTDREILLDLLARCRQAEQELYSRRRAVLRWAAAAFALLGAVAAVILLGWTTQGSELPPLEWVRGQLHALWLIAQGIGWWYVLGALGLLLAIVLVWRSGRKPD